MSPPPSPEETFFFTNPLSIGRRGEGCHVDDEPIADIAFENALERRLNSLDIDHLDIAGDTARGARRLNWKGATDVVAESAA